VPTEPLAEPLHQRLKYGGSVSARYTPSGTSMWKCTFRFKALPKRWMSVTAPHCAWRRVSPALRRGSLTRSEA
jgi:hypothetical protein